MRFKLPEIPKRNASRDIRRFLIFPKELNREIRWLEFATITQSWNWYHNEWQDDKWTDE